VPICADRGAAGGCSVLREHSLPPLDLTAAESLAVLAGLALLESSPYQAAARRAQAKIAAVVDEAHRVPVQELLGRMRVVDAVPTPDGAVPLAALSDVIASRRVVRLTHLGDDGCSTVRDVETTGLLRAGDAWVLAGWCRSRRADLARWPTRSLSSPPLAT